MRIAFLNIYQGIVDRGAENFVKEVSGRLKENNQVDIFFASGISETVARSQRPVNLLGKILFKFYLDAHSLRVLRFTLSMLPKILEKKYDWVISVDAGWQLLILRVVTKVQRFKGAKSFKILVSGQAGIGRDDLRNLRMGPDVFIALTKRAEEWAKTVNSKTRIAYIPNGVDLEKFNLGVKPAKIDLEKPIIICVAGLNPYKRVDLTIRAVAKLEKGSLLLLGDGPERDRIDEMGTRELGETRYKRLTVPYAEMPKYYFAADLFTLVSESSEAFGSAYVEAMACGLPVVATDDEMRREIIGGAGLFIDPLNLSSYSAAIEKALKTNWSDNSRKQAEKFSWDEIAKKYESAMKNFTGVPS